MADLHAVTFKDLPPLFQAFVNAAVAVAAYCPDAGTPDVGASWPVNFTRARELRDTFERFVANG